MKINTVNYFNDLDYSPVINNVLDNASKMLQLEQKELNIILVDNNYIQNLNNQFRHKDYPTDVLTFDDNTGNYLGDIFISLEKTKEQSDSLGHSFERELGFLVCHGLLHTLGYDHQTKEEEDIMTAMQEKILSKAKLFR